MTKIMSCPRCGSPLAIIKYTNWDNLETYMYPLCQTCSFTSRSVFDTREQIANYLKDIWEQEANDDHTD